MIKFVIKKELHDIIQSQKFLWAFAVTSFLIIITFYVGGNNFHLQQRQYEAALTENLRQMEGITEWSQITHHIFLPPDPLYTLVNGIDNDIGRNIEMFALGELTPNDSRYMQDPLYAAFRFLDLHFLFVIVLTLFAILFGYNLVNGEKESGTLSLVFANALPKDTFILGKLIGAIIAVCVPLLLPLFIGSLILIMQGVPMDGENWLRLVMIIGTGLLLFTFFLTLSVLFSSLTPRSSYSFLYMLVVWIFLVLIWPRSAVILAGRAVDVPGADDIAFQKAAYRSQIWQEDRQKLNSYQAGGGDIEKMMADFQKFMADLTDERNEKIMAYSAKLNEERKNRQRIQQSVAFSISRISPVSEFTFTSTQLAGTNLDLKDQYLDNAVRYQDVYQSFLRERVDGALPGAGLSMHMVRQDDEAKPIDANELPLFTYQKTDLSTDLNKSMLDISLLFVFNLFVFAGSVFNFTRFDVR